MPNVLGIERLRPVDVAGALNNGPSVGKNGEIVAISGEAEHELVVRHLSLRDALKDFRQGAKVQLIGSPMSHLHGVSATE